MKKFIAQATSLLILRLIKLYQQSWFLFSHAACRFRPTCSEYTYQAIERYGIIWGMWRGLKRILRCHPWSKGGDDPLK